MPPKGRLSISHPFHINSMLVKPKTTIALITSHSNIVPFFHQLLLLCHLAITGREQLRPCSRDMGCVQGKSTFTYLLPQGVEKLKQEYGYATRGNEVQKLSGKDSNGMLVQHEGEDKNVGMVNGANGGGEKAITKEGEIVRNEGTNGNVSQRNVSKKVGGDEHVDGWPKWLIDNISTEVLAGLVPRSADSYDKLDKVGQGTYSNVYKARDRDTGKIVALKNVRFNTSEPESVKFMEREIMMLQKLNHPNIISLEGLATSRMQYSLG